MKTLILLFLVFVHLGVECATKTTSFETIATFTTKTTVTRSTIKASSSNTTQSTSVTDPVIIKWTKSTGTGYGGYVNNVNKIQYSANYSYITTNSIPSYSIGPWTANPNNASGKNFTFKFPRKPTIASTKTKVSMGQMAVWINGLVAYDANDGNSYNNLGIWNRNAYYWEGVSFDSCKGHPDGSSVYHNHISSSCIFNSTNTTHSQIVGFAFDGYPIYGPYGYSSALNSSSSIRRIKTSYKLRNITLRTSLYNGTTLTSSQYGPPVNSTYPLGSYIEDYEYSSGYGDLDFYNGRWCVTPEYPNGTYAYFIATDSNLDPTYPFIIGPYFYGSPILTNMGPSGGYSSISESTTLYYSYSSSNSSSSSSNTTTTKSSTSTTTTKSVTTTKSGSLSTTKSGSGTTTKSGSGTTKKIGSVSTTMKAGSGTTTKSGSVSTTKSGSGTTTKSGTTIKSGTVTYTTKGSSVTSKTITTSSKKAKRFLFFA